MEDTFDVTLPTIHQALLDVGLPIVGVSGDPANPKTLRIDWEVMPSAKQRQDANAILDAGKTVRRKRGLQKSTVRGLTLSQKDELVCEMLLAWIPQNIDRAVKIVPELRPYLLEEV